MNETKVYSRASVFAWLEAQAIFVPEAAIALMWVRNPDRWKSEPRPYLLRARVAGDTIRDLIEALQQLDPDLKHDVDEVTRVADGVEGLGFRDQKIIDDLQDDNDEETRLRLRYEAALEKIADADERTAEELRDIARETLL